MIRPRRAIITGTGSFLPEKVLTNFDLEKMVDTSNDWILTRTGISERRIVDDNLAASDLAAEAATRALADAGLSPSQIDLLIVSTITPDTILPSCACTVQHRLGASRAAAFDITAACSGFLYGLSVGSEYVSSGSAQAVLVIGSECLSKITDYTDRASCVLFGDGAGAAVLEASNPSGDSPRGILNFILGSDGSGGDLMILPAGGSRIPASHDSVDKRLHYMKIRGREVFKFAVLKMVELVRASLEKEGLSVDQVKMVIPHQVNTRILQAAAEKLALPMEKVFVNIDRYGNTSAASIPIALDEARKAGLIEKGDLVVLVAFGGGLTWASCLMRW